MPTIVTLPHRLNVETMYDVIGRAIDEHQKARGQDITFDFSGLSFVDPDGMTVLSNLLEWLKKREVRIALLTATSDSQQFNIWTIVGFSACMAMEP